MCKYIQSAIVDSALVALFTMAVTLPVFASKSDYSNQCSACHMPNGSGNEAIRAPLIAGLEASYIIRQIKNFQSGRRGHEKDDASAQAMRGISMGLSEEKIHSLATYISVMPTPELIQEAQPTGFRGRGLYSGCSSCHGAQGEGNESLGAPRIANQHMWYLSSQLEKFRSDIRGDDTGDQYGVQMNAMAKAINNDADIETLINYISKLGE